jgi:xylulokinase
MLFLGLDVGSSSIKLSVLDGNSSQCVASTQYPRTELDILSPKPGWAEQDPETWWDCIVHGIHQLSASVDTRQIDAIGIAYQMHGLVLVDKGQRVLRPSIIWCDSRAVGIGQGALEELGGDYCYGHLLNSPGNFTAAKLRWVQVNEPELFARIHKAMLPGDFIVMKLSGEINTTAAGLSEGTLWDFRDRTIAGMLLDHWQISPSVVPPLVPNLGLQCEVSDQAAMELGLSPGTKITYRAGDQPNNAFSLNVLHPGDVAATAGTSGVIYGVTDQPVADRESRVNTFLHVTDSAETPRNGVLVCVNGTGRSYSWLRRLLAAGSGGQEVTYQYLNSLAASIEVGSEGLVFHPFGNGSERIFQNRTLGARMTGLDLNRHGLGHVVRAVQEGIVFALAKGFEVLESLGGSCNVVRAAKGNMFLSDIFTSSFANTLDASVELFDTDGAEGAARAAAVGIGFYGSADEAFERLERVEVVEPQAGLRDRYQQACQCWAEKLPV